MIGLICGNFQPYHHGHASLFKKALQDCEAVIVVINAAFSPRSSRQPFTASERKHLILLNLDARFHERLRFIEVSNSLHQEPGLWSLEVREKVVPLVISLSANADHSKSMARKDSLQGSQESELQIYQTEKPSPFKDFATRFPEWSVRQVERTEAVSPETVRERFLRDPNLVQTERGISPVTQKWLQDFVTNHTDLYRPLHQEQCEMDEYKASWAGSPYPPIFVATDALVLQAGHVLLIERGGSPGKGLLAMPGGFVESGEFLSTCAVRELLEETLFQQDFETILSGLKGVHVYDHPLRSARGRTIGHVHVFCFAETNLTPVKASDDAAKVRWVPVEEVKSLEGRFFEDHFYILQSLIPRYATNAPSLL